MNDTFYVGIDIADKTFTSTVMRDPDAIVCVVRDVSNDTEGFLKFLHVLQHHAITSENAMVVMECTGVYSEQLSHFLYNYQYQVYVEPPHKVKKAFTEKPKTDPVDSRQIAEYGYRFADKLHPWTPREQIVEGLHVLLTLREQFRKAQTASKNARRALTRKQHRQAVALALHEALITHLASHISQIEAEIRRMLQQNPLLNQQVSTLTTIRCVGFILAVNLAVVTDGFTKHVDYKQLAAYLGICPYPHESGTSVYRPPRSDKAGPSRLRKLLYLAAMSARRNHPTLARYYQRKVQEGKPGKLVLNNIENKLLKMMCAVIHSGKPYMEEYHSMNPHDFL